MANPCGPAIADGTYRRRRARPLGRPFLGPSGAEGVVIRRRRAACVRVTPKPAPLASSAVGAAMVCCAPLIIATERAPSAASDRLWPSRTALLAVKRTVPKSSSGTSPRPALGASSIHSADDRDEVWRSVVLYVSCVVLFTITMSHCALESSLRVTVTESPARTWRGTRRVDCGNVSVHASYSTTPDPVTVACVPAWMRSLALTPPMPTQVASAPAVVVETCGTVQVPVTDVYVPPVAT